MDLMITYFLAIMMFIATGCGIYSFISGGNMRVLAIGVIVGFGGFAAIYLKSIVYYHKEKARMDVVEKQYGS